MGKVSKNVLGTVKGKVAGVAFRTWRGMDLVASYAEENKSDSEKQKLQRTVFATANKQLKNFLCPARVGFMHSAVKTTEYAELVKANWPNIVADYNFKPEEMTNISISKGGLKKPMIGGVAYAQGQITITPVVSSLNPCGKNNPTDQIIWVVGFYQPGLGISEQVITASGERNTDQVVISIPDEWGEDASQLPIYAFAYNDEDASETEHYVGG